MSESLVLMQNHSPRIHESQRVVAFQMLDGVKWTLSKLSNRERWQLHKEDSLWMESSHRDRIYDVFNNLKERT